MNSDLEMNRLRELNNKKKKLENDIANINQEILEILDGVRVPSIDEAMKMFKKNGLIIYVVSQPLFICNGIASQVRTEKFLTYKSFDTYAKNLNILNRSLIIYLEGCSFEEGVLKLRINHEFNVFDIEKEISALNYRQFIRY